MTIEAIRTQLKGVSAVFNLVGTRIFYNHAPLDAATPFIVLLIVGNSPVNNLGGEESLTNDRVQIDCWSKRYSDSDTVAEAVKAAMAASTTFNAIRTGKDSLYESQTTLNRVMLEYSVWKS